MRKRLFDPNRVWDVNETTGGAATVIDPKRGYSDRQTDFPQDEPKIEPWMEEAACYFLFRKEGRYSSVEEIKELAQDIANCMPKK